MRADNKCEVEISISGDGEEYDSIKVPPCLQDAALGDTAQTTCSCPNPKDAIRLPKRYVQRLYGRHKEHKESKLPSGMDKENHENREKDLNTALKWIKQEIMSMKEQDKSLMKQFIHLRSTISQLRCMYELHSSSSDISSMSGSNISLDESMRSASPLGSPHHLTTIEDVEEPEFRSRTSSLLTPKKSPVTRIKWRSNEII